jgi:hypothetical protein
MSSALSKSKIIAYRQCAKRLWLEIHRPDLREDSAKTQASYRVGHTVGDIAKRIYDPEQLGTEICIERDGIAEAFKKSAELLADPTKPIFEAGFKAEGALAFADVMLPDTKDSKPGWRMIEVKSSASVKDYHHDDIAVQSFIARSAGVNLTAVELAHIDSSWVYPGADDYQGLLKLSDLTEEAFARTEEVRSWITDAQRVATQIEEPVVETGDHCHKPFDCGFCNYCNRDKHEPDFPLDWLPRLTSASRAELAEMGIDDLRAIPNGWLQGRQDLVRQHTLANTIYFDAAGAAGDLAPYNLPAYFMDFETVQLAVPIWAGTRPYQQNCFQFSMHKLGAEGRLSHCEFLDLSGRDPAEPFARALITACGEKGPVYVYNAAFEMTRIKELVVRFPAIAPALLAILSRIVDLLPIARTRYYHPAQKGSWSIKAVLPAAIPELSYDTLAGIKDGGMAMEAFCEALQPTTSAERKGEIERQLLAYCRLDTFAMVRLWQFFRGDKTVLVDSP